MPNPECFDSLSAWVLQSQEVHYARYGNLMTLSPATQRLFVLPARVSPAELFRLMHPDDMAGGMNSLRACLVNLPELGYSINVRFQLTPGIYTQFDLLSRRVDACPSCPRCQLYLGLFIAQKTAFRSNASFHES